MKGCLKFIVIGFLALCGLSIARYFFILTPEQRAEQSAKWEAARQAEDEAARVEREKSERDRERVDALKPEFIAWLQKNAGVSSARFKPGIMTDVLEVTFPHVWGTKDEARLKAEALAQAWRMRGRLDYAECAIFQGGEIFAEGVSK